MARNQEKAQSMLNRWISFKKDERLADKKERELLGDKPSHPNELQTIGDTERWRMEIIRDIAKKVMEIQNESLGEQRIRDLNDEINKMFKEKELYEKRILELGGIDYKAETPDEAATIPGIDSKGNTYKYFGAARNLPEVKDLFEKQEKAPQPKKTKYEYKGIGADYFGYNDDENVTLEEIEAKAEKQAFEGAMKEWKQRHKDAVDLAETDFQTPVPTMQMMEKLLVDKKKEELLRKYASDALIEELVKQKEEVEVVLGKRKA